VNRCEELLEWEREVSEAEENDSFRPDSDDSEWLWMLILSLYVL